MLLLVGLGNPTPNSNNNRALQYDYGSLSCRPIGNYDSQKWDVSNEKLTSKSLVIHNLARNKNDLNFRANHSVTDSDQKEVDPNKKSFQI